MAVSFFCANKSVSELSAYSVHGLIHFVEDKGHVVGIFSLDLVCLGLISLSKRSGIVLLFSL